MLNQGKKLIKNMVRPLYTSIKVYLNYYNDPEYREWYFKYSKRLLQFKNIHKGEDCFIIGNGPSLNKMDLSVLNDYYTFGLNKIYLLFDRVDLNLSYHVAVNPLVIEQSCREFSHLNCNSFLSYGPAKNIGIKSANFKYITTSGAPDGFQKDITMPIMEGGTVTYVALQLSYYMGFRNIYLIGVDHNFKASGNPNEKQILNGDDPNHFDPSYFANSEWHLPDLEASELSYLLARFFFNRDGRNIYDSTIDGKLQVFPKLDFDQALTLCKRKAV